MTEEKTFVFPESNKMDSGTLLALMNNRGNEGFGGNWLWVIFLFFLYGWGGRGFGMRDDAYEEGYEDGYRAAMEEMGMTSYRMGERNNRR